MKKIFLAFVFGGIASVLSAAGCGQTVYNPYTGKLDCIGTSSGGGGSSSSLAVDLGNVIISSPTAVINFSSNSFTATQSPTGQANIGINFSSVASVSSLPVPGGSNTNVQINNSGSFYGDSGFQYDSSVSSVTLTGNLGIGSTLNITGSSPALNLFNIGSPGGAYNLYENGKLSDSLGDSGSVFLISASTLTSGSFLPQPRILLDRTSRKISLVQDSGLVPFVQFDPVGNSSFTIPVVLATVLSASSLATDATGKIIAGSGGSGSLPSGIGGSVQISSNGALSSATGLIYSTATATLLSPAISVSSITVLSSATFAAASFTGLISGTSIQMTESNTLVQYAANGSGNAATSGMRINANDTVDLVSRGQAALEVTATPQIQSIQAGTDCLPAYSFTNDAGTGMLLPSIDHLEFAAGCSTGMVVYQHDYPNPKDNTLANIFSVFGGSSTAGKNQNTVVDFGIFTASITSTAAQVAQMNQLGGFVVVQGHDSGFTVGYTDILLSSFYNPTPTIVASHDDLGSPAPRTYSSGGNSTGVLNCSVASGTYYTQAWETQLRGK